MNSIKDIYRNFKKDLSFNMLCSSTIAFGLLLIYLLFVAFAMEAGASLLATGLFGSLMILVFVSLTLGLLTPFIYSFFACNGVLHTNKKDDVTFKSFFKTYLIGTRHPFKSQLRIWNTLLNSVLFYILFETIAMFLFAFISSSVEASPYYELMQSLQALNPSSTNYLGEIDRILKENETLLRTPSLIINFASLCPSVYYFIHSVAKNTLRYFLAPSMLNAPTKLITYVYKLTMRNYKSDYNKGYFKVMWPLTVIYFVTFTTSYFLIAFLGPSFLDTNVLGLTVILISVVALLPFLPLVFNYHEFIWPRYSSYFMKTFIDNASRELNEVKKSMQADARFSEHNIDIAEKNIEKMKKLFDEQQEMMKKEAEKDNEASKEESKDSSEDQNKNE